MTQCFCLGCAWHKIIDKWDELKIGNERKSMVVKSMANLIRYTMGFIPNLIVNTIFKICMGVSKLTILLADHLGVYRVKPNYCSK